MTHAVVGKFAKRKNIPTYQEQRDTQKDNNEVKGVAVDCEGKLNKGHYHELIDRTHIICSMLDDYVIDHPGMTEEMNEQCYVAQHSLKKMQLLAAEKEESIFGI